VVAVADRKMISVDEQTYKQLMKAKAELEQKSGKGLSLGQAVGVFIAGAVAGYGITKLAQELMKEDKKKGV